MRKLYEKSQIWFAVVWIVAYCVLMSVGDALSATLGVEKSVTLVVGLVLSIILLLFLHQNDLFEAYGLCAAKVSARTMLYYVPVLVMLTANLWYGTAWNYGVAERVLYVLMMLCVGFLEEAIFRGLLFEAMRKDSERAAIIVSAVTFGIGHIINLVNGSGAELVTNLLQVLYATVAGFMFVMIYVKSKSLVGCMVIHGVFNALSVFTNEAAMTPSRRVVSAVLLTVITGTYAAWLAWTMRKTKE